MIDSHAHLDHHQFDPDRDAVLERSRAAGVDGWIIPATTPHSARLLLAAPWRTNRVWPTVGIHPHDVKDAVPGTLEELENILLSFPEIVALGETGLDYFYDAEYSPAQVRFFEAHLELAERYNRPVIVHARDGKDRHAYTEILEIIRTTRAKGVLHSFTGTLMEAMTAVEAGWYIGVGGIATFKQSEALREILGQIPVQRLLIETDAPYLAPIPHRGKRNEPAFLVKSIAVLADLKGLLADDLAVLITANTQSLFRLT